MPRKGFRSITVREEIYEDLMQQYTENKEELLKEGRSFPEKAEAEALLEKLKAEG